MFDLSQINYTTTWVYVGIRPLLVELDNITILSTQTKLELAIKIIKYTLKKSREKSIENGKSEISEKRINLDIEEFKFANNMTELIKVLDGKINKGTNYTSKKI